jgi:hypothetical protein
MIVHIFSVTDINSSMNNMKKIDDNLEDLNNESVSNKLSADDYDDILLNNKSNMMKLDIYSKPEIFARPISTQKRQSKHREISQADEIINILEETRRAIQDINRKKSYSKDILKESKTPKSKTPKSKTPKSKTPKSKTPKSKTPKSKTPKFNNYIKNKQKYYSDGSDYEIYDRGLNVKKINLQKTSKTMEKEEELFKSLQIYAKNTKDKNTKDKNTKDKNTKDKNTKIEQIDDRRLSKERQVIETRLGRLRKSLHTF